MTTTGKVLIISGTCLLLGAVALVGAGVYWWTHHSRVLIQAGKNAVKEGSVFGKSADNQGCLDEALSRYKQNKGFGGGISTGLFLTGCLEASRATPGFCDDVPKPTEFIRSAHWQINKCEEAGLPDQYCRQLFSQVQQYCERTRSKGK